MQLVMNKTQVNRLIRSTIIRRGETKLIICIPNGMSPRQYTERYTSGQGLGVFSRAPDVMLPSWIPVFPTPGLAGVTSKLRRQPIARLPLRPSPDWPPGWPDLDAGSAPLGPCRHRPLFEKRGANRFRRKLPRQRANVVGRFAANDQDDDRRRHRGGLARWPAVCR